MTSAVSDADFCTDGVLSVWKHFRHNTPVGQQGAAGSALTLTQAAKRQRLKSSTTQFI